MPILFVVLFGFDIYFFACLAVAETEEASQPVILLGAGLGLLVLVFFDDLGQLPGIAFHIAAVGGGVVVRDLSGHGVGLEFHEDPEVDHYGHRGTGMLLVPGMVFTIEPMINMGTYKVFVDADDPWGWEVISEDELPSAQWEHTFLMTETGLEILTH